MIRPAPSPVAARGVYVLPYLGPNDERVMVAVDRRGRIVSEVRIVDQTTWRSAEAFLWSQLDTADPDTPVLKVVR